MSVVILGEGLGGIFVVARWEILLEPRVSIINWRDCTVFVEVRTSAVAFSKTNKRKRRDAGEENDEGVATLGGIRLFTLRLNTGTVSME